MRVLHIVHSYFPRIGGVEHHVQSILGKLVRQGVDPLVLTPRWSPDELQYDVVDGVRVTREGLFGLMQNKPVSVRDVYRLGRWFKVIRAYEPDLIHVHGPFSPILGLPVRFASWMPVQILQALGLLGCPVIVTFHGLWAHYRNDEYDRDRKHVKVGSLFIGVDKAICRDLTERFGVATSKVDYIPNGVDNNTFHPANKDLSLLRELGLSASDRVILVPRRVDPKNGIEFAVRAFARVSQQVPDAKMILLGVGMGTSDAGYTGRIVSLIRGMGLDSRVICHPGLPYGEMPRIYRLAEVTVIPSLWEATSLAALESLASGIPVIASRVGGLEDLIDESCGILVPPADAESLADALCDLLTSHDARDHLARGGSERAGSYDWSTVADRTLSVYNRAIGRKTP